MRDAQMKCERMVLSYVCFILSVPVIFSAITGETRYWQHFKVANSAPSAAARREHQHERNPRVYDDPGFSPLSCFMLCLCLSCRIRFMPSITTRSQTLN